MKNYLLLSALLFTAACTAPSAQEEAFVFNTTAAENAQTAFSSRIAIGLPATAGLSKEAQQARISAASRAAMPRFWDAYPQLEASSDLTATDALARTLISETPEEGRWLMEQYVGQYMLEKLLATENAHTDYVAFYVELLHRNDSQRADLLAGGLSRLQRTWPREKVQAYAADGVAHAEHWLGRVGRASSAKAAPESLPPQHTNRDGVAQYVGQLAALAGR